MRASEARASPYAFARAARRIMDGRGRGIAAVVAALGAAALFVLATGGMALPPAAAAFDFLPSWALCGFLIAAASGLSGARAGTGRSRLGSLAIRASLIVAAAWDGWRILFALADEVAIYGLVSAIGYFVPAAASLAFIAVDSGWARTTAAFRGGLELELAAAAREAAAREAAAARPGARDRPAEAESHLSRYANQGSDRALRAQDILERLYYREILASALAGAMCGRAAAASIRSGNRARDRALARLARSAVPGGPEARALLPSLLRSTFLLLEASLEEGKACGPIQLSGLRLLGRVFDREAALAAGARRAGGSARAAETTAELASCLGSVSAIARALGGAPPDAADLAERLSGDIRLAWIEVAADRFAQEGPAFIAELESELPDQAEARSSLGTLLGLLSKALSYGSTTREDLLLFFWNLAARGGDPCVAALNARGRLDAALLAEPQALLAEPQAGEDMAAARASTGIVARPEQIAYESRRAQLLALIARSSNSAGQEAGHGPARRP
jgi:hypothetical protein